MRVTFGQFRALALGLAFILSACSAPEPVVSEAGFAYIASVDIKDGDSSATLAKRYNGEVISYQPEAGFAVLGFSETQGELSVLADLEPNADLFIGNVAQASGFNAWSQGFSAWSQGFNAWSNTTSAIDADMLTNFSEANIAAFKMTGLLEARALQNRGGAGIKVAVIDTGLDLNHVFLKDRLVPPHEWIDFVDDDRLPQDEKQGNASMFGHGTAVAGLVAQNAPNAKILPIRVLNSDGSGHLDDIITAIDWAINQRAQVINLSLGTHANSDILKLMVAYAAYRGIHVVVASGNLGKSSMDHPATYANGLSYANGSRNLWFDHDYMLSVASADPTGQLSSFSNHGGNLEFLAPGENVFSIYPQDLVGSFTGTSFAAPQIAGMVALALGEGAAGPLEARLGAASKNEGGSSYGIPSLAKLLGGS